MSSPKTGNIQTDGAEEAASSEGKSSIHKWCTSHVWVGQQLSSSSDESSVSVCTSRKLFSILFPLSLTWIAWWSYAIATDSFYKFTEEINGIPRYYMSITMVLGSFVAGATAEGGASIAFPVMTLAFSIIPSVARDFSFMIQSVGMTAAAFSILYMRIKIEWKSIIYCSIGGLIGIIVCLSFIAQNLAPAFSKMYFVSIWFSFAFSLYYLNRTHDRKVYNTIPRWEDGVLCSAAQGRFSVNWKCIVLLVGGFIGGVFSGIAGSGIDICSFAMLTLLFRVSEKTATPTSIVLMAINTCVGFAFNLASKEISQDAWNYFFVCIPIVVVGAPFGSIIGSFLHREVLASFVYVTDTVQLVAAFVIVQPWNISTFLFVSSMALVVLGALVFAGLTRIGLSVMERIELSGLKHKGKESNESAPTEGGDKTVVTIPVV